MIKRFFAVTAFTALTLAASLASARPGRWHFLVANATSVNIVKLQVSENKRDWSAFDIGKGIRPGETATLYWDSKTDEQGCEQWIRAKYADGVYSKPSKQDFCNDLDDPIEFTEDEG